MAGAYVNPRVRVEAARIAGKSPERDVAAGKTLRAVQTVAAANRLTGEYMSKLHVVTAPGLIGNGRLVDDRLIVSDDPASPSIEYGHLVRFKNARRVRWVPGQYPMTRGLAMVQ